MGRAIQRIGGTRFCGYGGGNNGRSAPYFCWESEHPIPLVVQQSVSRFEPCSANMRLSDILEGRGDIDPLSGEPKVALSSIGGKKIIFSELFELEVDPVDFLRVFPSEMEESAGIPDDSFLWFETGFWSARSMPRHFIGIGTSAAEDLLGALGEGSFCIVFSYPSALLSYRYDFGSEKESAILEAFLANLFTPFAETRRTLHRALSACGKWTSVRSSLSEFATIQQPRHAEPSRNESRPQIWNWDNTFSLKPPWVVKAATRNGRRFYSLAVFQRPFGPTPWEPLNSLPFVLAFNSDGHWMDEDFEPERRYQLYRMKPLFLSTCIVLECAFVDARRFQFQF